MSGLDSLIADIQHAKRHEISDTYFEERKKVEATAAYKKIAEDMEFLEKKKEAMLAKSKEYDVAAADALREDAMNLRIKGLSADKKDLTKMVEDFKAKKY